MPVMSKPVFIHAGAHRTGTSSFQLCLAENRGLLDRHGLDVVYPGRDGVPGGRLRMPMPRPRHGAKRIPAFAADLRAHLSKLAPDPDRGLVISEENIPGPMHHFYEGRFFPASARRLAVLAQALEGRAQHLLYVLRPYDALYVSAYRKRAEDNPVPPFAELAPQFLAMDRGWPALVAEFRDILRPETLTVIDYARRGSSAALLARLVPQLAAEPLAEPARLVNLSATDRALEVLQARYRAGEELARKEWQEVIAEHQDDRADRGFAAFAAEDADRLRARYAADIETIAAMDGVTFL
ncbi:hypothetical protein GCM10017056_48160 [Seohaeicola zhoushanensis]|uniref:Sulfotransferase family protein n=2 Tax=Seohaeicola zhoushanensis TaxID=1569283 RepID=A0A8J3H1A8_9RHOB|nr:hypothetical protein GCM10017056_48160 [Seohaeicola zhoushanensis]